MHRHDLLSLDVTGRPAPYATAHEASWKRLVREAIAGSGVQAQAGARFSVRLEFRLPAPRNANEVWDLDNLVKPTLDAMEGVFGLRQWQGPAQAADDRVDHIEARKREVREGEKPGARIDVWALVEGPE
jgi:Holliday junction resolvase RusA-like endonuclease